MANLGRITFIVFMTTVMALAQIGGTEGVAAVVNDQVITRFEIEKLMFARGRDMANMPESNKKQLYDQILKTRVFEILKAKAAKDSGIALSEEDLINRKISKIQDEGFSSEEAWRESLRQKGESEEKWNENFKENEEARAWLAVTSGRAGLRGPQVRQQYSLTVTPKEMRDYYAKHQKDEFQQKIGAKVRVIQIYFRTGNVTEKQRALQKAEGIIANLATRADFAVLAAKNSQHPTKDSGGVVGEIEPDTDKVPAVIAQAVFADKVKAGDVLGPIEHVNSYWVVEVTERREARTVPFEEAQPYIRAALESRKYNRAIYAIIYGLVQDSYIQPAILKRQLEDELRAFLSN